MKKIFILLIPILITSIYNCKAADDSTAHEPLVYKFNPEMYFLITHNQPVGLLSNFIFTIPTFAKVPRLTLTGELYTQRNPSFGEVLFGPSYTSPLFEGGVMFGFQTEHPEIRIGPWMALRDRQERFSMWAYYEYGFDPSIRAEATWRISKRTATTKLKTGIKWYEENLGPTINIERGKSYLSFAYIYGWNDKTDKILTSIGWNL